MSNAVYVVRNRSVDQKLNKIAAQINLIMCYQDKQQCIMKNDKLLVSQKKRYLFLRAFSENELEPLDKLYQYLVGAQVEQA